MRTPNFRQFISTPNVNRTLYFQVHFQITRFSPRHHRFSHAHHPYPPKLPHIHKLPKLSYIH
nr:MAG TPA: hypothetical protein [Caudoviricetes sp.]